jgi:hypothetical protein
MKKNIGRIYTRVQEHIAFLGAERPTIGRGFDMIYVLPTLMSCTWMRFDLFSVEVVFFVLFPGPADVIFLFPLVTY